MKENQFVDYMVFEPRQVNQEEVEQHFSALMKQPKVFMTEVFSPFYNEIGFVFSTNKVREEEALRYFEEEREQEYEEMGV